MVFTTVTVFVQKLLLPQQSVAFHVRLMTCRQELDPLFVTVFTVTGTMLLQQLSETLGGSNDQVWPHCTVLSGAQVIVGGVVSRTVMVWLQVLVLPQQSRANQVRVITIGQLPLFVTVLRMTA